jgi:Family of unknown function (DUF6093)
MKLDLTHVEPIVESLMVDTCEIYVETLGSVNVSTGTQAVTQTALYSGPCLVGPPGMSTDGDSFFTFLLPISTDPISRGATVEVTVSQDSQLVGKKFDTVGTMIATYNACRVVTAAMRMPPAS